MADIQPHPKKACLFCGRDEHETPLVVLDFRGTQTWICPQHLPILIHDPTQLAGVLPGAEGLSPAEHHD
jgi:hypothetical protein